MIAAWKAPSGTPDGGYWAMLIMIERPMTEWKAALAEVPEAIREDAARELRAAWRLARERG